MSSSRQPDHLRANSVDPDDYRDAKDTVDPYLRAHVHSLVAALGGPSPEKDGGYVLGDEAQYVLRDLKKWLRAYDEKLNRLDVARCLAESKLVGNDLVEILASWPEDKVEDRRWYRLALSCCESNCFSLVEC
jgi:replication fork protection complex subunit Tof1/Swi1